MGRRPKQLVQSEQQQGGGAAAAPPPALSSGDAGKDDSCEQSGCEKREGGGVTVTAADVAAPLPRPHLSDTAPFSLVLYRHYNPPRQNNDEIDTRARRMNAYSEAVLHKVLTVDAVPSLMMAMNGEWILHKEGKRVKLCNDVYLNVTRNDRTEWDVNALELTLTSSKRSANQLVKYVEQLHEEYQQHVSSALRGAIYFFDHKEFQDFRGSGFEGTSSATQRRFDVMNAPKHLSFQQLPFHSNKTFDNLCGPQVRLISKRLEFFVRNKEWYDRKGIPWQLGFMFSGEPGCGKSSCIRAMANFTGRHIVNVNFSNIKTVTQLKKLFYSEEIDVYKDDESRETTRLKVPVNQRIFVMEEIDALGKTVLDRKGCEGDAVFGKNGAIDSMHKSVADEITLADLLHILDGNMEVPGRILVVTCKSSNLLDTAIIRPGRIDVDVEFELASRDTIADMYLKMHEEQLSKGMVLDIPDRQLSPADVTEIMFRNFGVKKADMAMSVIRDLKQRASSASDEKQKRVDAVREHISKLSGITAASASASAAVPVPASVANTGNTLEHEEAKYGMKDSYEAFLAACDDDTLLGMRGGNNDQR
jgi:AAA+ superfamily predicted ATPase